MRFSLGPLVPPGLEELPLCPCEFTLRGAKGVFFVDVMLVLRIPFQHHQVFVVEDEVRTFVKGRENSHRVVEFFSVPSSFNVAACGLLTEFHQPQHRFGQRVADAGDRPDRAAADEAMKDLRIDADHERQCRISARDMLGGIGQGLRAAKFLEADQIRMLTT